MFRGDGRRGRRGHEGRGAGRVRRALDAFKTPRRRRVHGRSGAVPAAATGRGHGAPHGRGPVPPRGEPDQDAGARVGRVAVGRRPPRHARRAARLEDAPRQRRRRQGACRGHDPHGFRAPPHRVRDVELGRGGAEEGAAGRRLLPRPAVHRVAGGAAHPRHGRAVPQVVEARDGGRRAVRAAPRLPDELGRRDVAPVHGAGRRAPRAAHARLAQKGARRRDAHAGGARGRGGRRGADPQPRHRQPPAVVRGGARRVKSGPGAAELLRLPPEVRGGRRGAGRGGQTRRARGPLDPEGHGRGHREGLRPPDSSSETARHEGAAPSARAGGRRGRAKKIHHRTFRRGRAALPLGTRPARVERRGPRGHEGRLVGSGREPRLYREVRRPRHRPRPRGRRRVRRNVRQGRQGGRQGDDPGLYGLLRGRRGDGRARAVDRRPRVQTVGARLLPRAQAHDPPRRRPRGVFREPRERARRRHRRGPDRAGRGAVPQALRRVRGAAGDDERHDQAPRRLGRVLGLQKRAPARARVKMN
mmetsp:Transcript_36299/g.112319  ORF Transcript_36299/g.112319 Transcript_36299/m.112319 type:complete len:529 (+) Transcript_36299:180-1766(+)